MRIAFYAPMKPPTHGTPSGDRRVAGLYMRALGHCGHRVELASTFRSYDPQGDARRQAALRAQGVALARRMAAQWRAGPSAARPELWFTYHVYHKAPDWLGPEVSADLGVPYVIAEASYGAKRAGGPWSMGHQAAGEAIRSADLVLCATRHDIPGLAPLVPPERIMLLPPFLDATPFRAAARERAAHRARLAAAQCLDPGIPWIVVAAMMRPGDKLASYRALAAALARVQDKPWQLLVAGGGAAHAEVEAALEAAVPGRVAYLGTLALPEVAAACAASDLFVWPAVNEAYGMAMLEAAAAGIPVVSCALRGVPDVVLDGKTGLLAPADDCAGLAQTVRELLEDASRRAAMGIAAASFIGAERSVEAAGARLNEALGHVISGAKRSAAPLPQAVTRITSP